MKPLWTMPLLILFGSVAAAQFSVETNFGMMVDDNIDNNYMQIRDRIAAASLDLGYFWSGDEYETGISYSGGVNYYSQVIERSYGTNEALYQYTRLLGEEEATELRLDAGFSNRIDRGRYTAYDHQLYRGEIGVRHTLSDGSTIEGSYSPQIVRFKNLPDFNYTEHSFGGRFSTSFESKTSVILESNFGIKAYSTQTSSTTTTGGGTGHGQQQSGQSVTTTESSPSVTQLITSARVGQSIFEKTGISLAATYQWNIKKESRYLLFGDGSIPDDAIFDDHYGYEGLLVSAMLTQVLPFESRIRATLSRQDRLYSTLPAYDLTGAIVSDKRNDTRTALTVQLKKDFEALGVTLNAVYDYIVNESNDKFFDYTNQAISLSISVGM
jgi:hypothetical protein